MSIVASKVSLVHELFVRTADENYVTARWCAVNDLKTDFLWLALHAVEKYLKAVLLVNGRSSRGYGHDVIRLYADVQKIAGDLLPDRLNCPDRLETSYWFDRTPEEFIAHLSKYGNADNRYMIYGYSTWSQDLHMLDAIVFAVRRLIVELDEPMFCEEQTGVPAPKYREILKRQPKYYNRLAMPLDNIIHAQAASERRHAALNCNTFFAPKGYSHEPIQSGYAGRETVIIRRILEPLESCDPQQAAKGVELADWFLANVQVPSGKKGEDNIPDQIKKAVADAKARHLLP